ncbi:MAG: DNA-binding protein [Candidatus Solibacter sp.]|nr:DNA-binding protein [Candidatus Solibacter sp.]
MSVPPELVEILRQWVRKAEHDLEAVRRILAVEQGCPFDVACFHCQQAVEKYIKAVLTMESIPAPRTHDLEQLAALLPKDKQLSVPLPTLAAMNPYAVEVRYADDWREPQLSDANAALEIAQRVRDEVRRLLPSDALE